MIFTATLTPLNTDLSCNHSELANHCLNLINQGANGITLCGTTGEGPSFSIQEKKEMLLHLIKNGVKSDQIILGGSCQSIPDTVEMAKIGVNAGCRALLIAPPSFYKGVEEEGVTAFYREVIKRVPDVKIILYHIPQLSVVPISLNTIDQLLAEFPSQVIGLKESEGNLPFLKSVLQRFPGFAVFVGKETHIIEAVRLGASGVICGLGNAFQPLITSLYAGEANPQIERISHSFRSIPFIPALKAVLEQRRGKAWHSVRPPLIPLTQEQKETFLKEFS